MAREIFGVDLRSLAVLRVGLAVALLYDTLDRSRDLVALYTDAGAFPVETALVVAGSRLLASPFSWVSHSPFLVALLFALLGLSALALLLGWRTRLSALLCWLLLLSLQLRNPLAAALGGDKLLRIILFWSLFLPLGARGSLDALRSNAARYPNPLVCVPGAVLLLQICVMYWTTGLLKNGGTWSNGTAVTFALRMDYWASPLGLWLRDLEAIHPLLTHSTRWFEMLGPFLAFVPVAFGPVRTATVVLFAGFHLSLAAFMNIGPFPLFCIIAWSAFLPPWFWDSLLPRLVGRTWLPSAPSPGPRGVPRLAQGLVGVLFILVVLQVSGPLIGRRVLPGPLLQVVKAVQIHQNWSMFAPDPPAIEQWPVFHGELRDGSVVDPLRTEPPLQQKPALVSASFPSFRWRLYLAYVMQHKPGDPGFEPMQQALGAYLCRDWNASHPDARALERVRVEYWLEDNRDLLAPPEQLFVYAYDCVQSATDTPSARSSAHK